MSGPGTAMGISVTLVTADQQAPLGFIHTVPASVSPTGLGPTDWIYVRADPAGAGLASTNIISGGSGPGIVDVAAAALTPAACIGVAQHAIPAGEWGFILKSGVGMTLDDGTYGTLGGAGIVCGAGGAATEAAALTDAVIGVALDSPGVGVPALSRILL